MLCLSAACLQAKENTATRPLLNIGAGVYDIIHNPENVLGQLEYRFAFQKHPPFRPLVGIMGTDKASFYVCAGGAYDLFLGTRFVLTPSFAPGLYFKGKGKNLHFPLEFRSSMELAFVFKNQARIGGQFYHISNASLGRKNPGAEALVFFYSLPL